MSSKSLIASHLADVGLTGDGLIEVVQCAMSNGESADIGKFVEDMAAAPWFRAIVERWPMLGQEIWASPEIMLAEPDLERARAILVADGASRVASVFGEVRLKPVDPIVLDWLEGRLWNTSASTDMILAIAIDVLPLLGPEGFPENEERWVEMMRTLSSAMMVFCQDGVPPAGVLDTPGMRSIMAIVVSRSDSAVPRSLDVHQASAIVAAAFGPEGNDLIDNLKTYYETTLLARANATFPMSLDGPKV